MKLGIVYTSTTPELIECVNEEIRKNLGDTPEILNYQDPSILAEVREHGYVTASAAARLVGMYMQAVSDGADAILNCCSSVGEVADAAQNIGRYTGIPIVRIDEEMCREAARLGKRVGVLATLPTTLEPTKNTVSRVAREMNSHVELVDGLVDAFGADQDKFKALLCAKAEEIADQAAEMGKAYGDTMEAITPIWMLVVMIIITVIVAFLAERMVEKCMKKSACLMEA